MLARWKVGGTGRSQRIQQSGIRFAGSKHNPHLADGRKFATIIVKVGGQVGEPVNTPRGNLRMKINKWDFRLLLPLSFALLISPSAAFGGDHRSWVMDDANCVLSRSSDTTMVLLEYNRYDTSSSPHPGWLLALGVGKSYDSRSILHNLHNFANSHYNRFVGVVNIESYYKDPFVVSKSILELESGLMIMNMQHQALIQLFDSAALTLFSPALPFAYSWTLHGIGNYRDKFLACKK